MSTTALTLSPKFNAGTAVGQGWTYTPRIADAAFFAWLDEFCGDRFNRFVVRVFGPA